MILVDTSAWIEFLRDTGSSVCNRVDETLDTDLAICDPIRMEVLAGARASRTSAICAGCSRAPRWCRRIRSTTRTQLRCTAPAAAAVTQSAN